MGKGKNKFDLTHLVRAGFLKEGESLYFISDPSYNCVIEKMPNHEFKLNYKGEVFTVHAICQQFLGTEPPDHACRWLRNENGKTLYELWQADLDELAA